MTRSAVRSAIIAAAAVSLAAPACSFVPAVRHALSSAALRAAVPHSLPTSRASRWRSLPAVSDDEAQEEGSPWDNPNGDDDEELSLAAQAAKIAAEYAFDPVQKQKELALSWEIADAADNCEVDVMNPENTNIDKCGVMCATCDGTGETECRFCKGTGFFTIGEDLIGTGNECPVCKGTGYEVCSSCMGAGTLATWRGSIPSTDNKGKSHRR